LLSLPSSQLISSASLHTLAAGSTDKAETADLLLLLLHDSHKLWQVVHGVLLAKYTIGTNLIKAAPFIPNFPWNKRVDTKKQN
jgi:hypothetical protein